jgi:hypothetical protein
VRYRKNATIQLLLLLSALAHSAACVPQVNTPPLSETPTVTPSSTPTRLIAPTSTCSWGWGPYIGKEVPSWTNAWKETFSETDLEASELKVEGVGETSVKICNGETTESWGTAYAEIKATIIVDDVKDSNGLGNTLAKVYQAVKILTTNEKDLAEANLSILFVSRKDKNEVMRRNCNHNQGIIMVEQGKVGKELFEATCSE